jgi:UDP-N-acetyl-D-mannosaminuronate dehydrogenase
MRVARKPVKVVNALRRSLAHIDLLPEDEAIAYLGMHYARQIDAGKKVPLVEVLIQLNMTPKARTGVIKPNDDTSRNKLDELSARREARAKAVDA